MERIALYSKDGIYTLLGLVGCSTNSHIIPQNPAGGPSPSCAASHNGLCCRVQCLQSAACQESTFYVDAFMMQ